MQGILRVWFRRTPNEAAIFFANAGGVGRTAPLGGPDDRTADHQQHHRPERFSAQARALLAFYRTRTSRVARHSTTRFPVVESTHRCFQFADQQVDRQKESGVRRFAFRVSAG